MIRLNIENDFAMSTSDVFLADVLSYFSFADAFGWTPEQVDCVDLVVLDGLICVMNEKNEVEKRMMKNASRR